MIIKRYVNKLSNTLGEIWHLLKALLITFFWRLSSYNKFNSCVDFNLRHTKLNNDHPYKFDKGHKGTSNLPQPKEAIKVFPQNDYNYTMKVWEDFDKSFLYVGQELFGNRFDYFLPNNQQAYLPKPNS